MAKKKKDTISIRDYILGKNEPQEVFDNAKKKDRFYFIRTLIKNGNLTKEEVIESLGLSEEDAKKL